MNIQNIITLIFDEKFAEVKEYITANKPNLNIVSEKGNTPLLCAIDTNNTEIVEFLLRNGAAPNFTNRKVNLPLIQAIEIAVETEDYNDNVSEISTDIIQKLVNYGAKIDLKDKNGDTPYSFAKDLIFGHKNCLKK